MGQWKTWKTLAVLQAACKGRNLDTSHCIIKKEYCQVLNDYEQAQEAAAGGAGMPSNIATKASQKRHKHHDSKDPTTSTPQINHIHKSHAPATRQDLRLARTELQVLHQKVPLVLEQARKLQIRPLRVAPAGKVISRISKLRAGILTFDIEGVDKTDIGHYVKETRAQTDWLEFELQQLVEVVVARQRRGVHDNELVKQDSSGMMEAMLSSVSELVSVGAAILEKAHALQHVEVEDSKDWPLEFESGSERGSYEERLAELEREMSWLERDIAKWEHAIVDWEDLMG